METEPQPTYAIRKATTADVEAIRRMQAQSWRDTYENEEIGATKSWLAETTQAWLTDDELAKSQEHLSKCFTDPAQFYRVAEQNGEIVGLLHLDTKEDGTKHLWGLYTAKQTHGTGLAQQLMAQANKWIGDQDAELEVASYNGRAKAFYEKYGFIDAGETGELFKDKIPTTRMIRKGPKSEV